MKTKIRTFIGLVALGVIGFTNIDATAATLNSDLYAMEVLETDESLTIEDWMLESTLWVNDSETKAEAVTTEKAIEIESWMTDEDFFKTAESYTASGSEEEIAKYAARQIALMEIRNSK